MDRRFWIIDVEVVGIRVGGVGVGIQASRSRSRKKQDYLRL